MGTMVEPPRGHYEFLVRRLLAYIVLIGLVGTLFWLFAFLRDLY